MNDLLKSNRKYKAFIVVFLMASAMLVFERLSGGEWVTLVIAVFGLYTGGNVYQKKMETP